MPENTKKLNVLTVVAIVILLTQCAFIIQARFEPARYFCWGMFHSVSTYEIQSALGDKQLSAHEIKARYGRPATGVEARSIQHVKDVIAQRERSSAQPARVRLVYRVNGKAEEEWIWAK